MIVHRVRFEPIDIAIAVSEDETVLDAALRQGLPLPHECRTGRCASCKSMLLYGHVERGKHSRFALEPEEMRLDHILLCRTRPRSDLVVRLLRCDADLLQAGVPAVQTFQTTVMGIEPLTHDIRHLVLGLPRGERMLFRAGQYAEIRLPGSSEYRPFSMANTPRTSDHLEFLIKVYPGGRFSGLLAEGGITTGQQLEVRGPFGLFTLREQSDGDILCVGAGSGLAPLWSLLNDLVERGIHRRVTLYYTARTRKDLFYLDRLRELEEGLPSFRFVPVLSRPSTEDEWDGECGRITDVVARTWTVRHPETEAYLCGPPGLIEAMLLVLAQKGIAETQMFYEKFTSAGSEG